MIIPPNLAIRSLRDNGYKNAASAIAELIDNSIQHKSKNVELVCLEQDIQLKSSVRSQLHRIAVIDNGSGMNEDVLYRALQFGNGTNLNPENQKGMGKFGMGLPSSSISQAKKVEVWTWKNGLNSAIYSYLCVTEIEKGIMTDVPEPISKEIPSEYIKISNLMKDSQSGTLVLWSNLDRCNWKTATSIFKHSESLIGRMYRYFIDSKKAEIKFLAYNTSNYDKPTINVLAKPNDPLYLMSNTACPDPFHDKPMFEKWGNDIIYPVKYGEIESQIKVRFSYSKPESRANVRNAGDLPYGKHAKTNIGISILRANRELLLDKSLTIGHNTRERWWGCEVEFEPELDEVFGVTNNKQYASNFTEVASIVKGVEDNLISKEEINDEFDEEDPKKVLVNIILDINSKLSTIRSLIQSQKEGSGGEKARHTKDSNTPESIATDASEKRESEGKKSVSDNNPHIKDQDIDIVTEELKDEGLSEEEIENLIKFDEKYVISSTSLDSDAFFSVNVKYDKVLVQLNVNHPAYRNLMEILDDNELSTEMSYEERLKKASLGIKLLLLSWARYEDEQIGNFKERAQQFRREWGKVARDFMDIED
ncbi:ATP-binding protein [Flavobacterium chuncheonense]|uniref:ATP-binding protein n=1 Tax=Flavobacterium chuncheonense TaxID=2026653 RepID=A0ABW5YL96_9FLAO